MMPRLIFGFYASALAVVLWQIARHDGARSVPVIVIRRRTYEPSLN